MASLVKNSTHSVAAAGAAAQHGHAMLSGGPSRCPAAQRRSMACFAQANAQVNSLAIYAGAATSLATYQWPTASLPVKQRVLTRSPTKLWTTTMWFEAMVQTVVKQLQGDAFVLRVSVHPVLSLQLVRLQPSDLAAGWEHIQRRHLASALQQDDAVILVHPVASGEQQPCMVRQTAGEPCAGCPHAAADTAAAAAATAAAYGGGVTASFAAAAEATELLHGKFGDCCSGEDEHSHAHDSHHSHQQQQQQPEAQAASYYGLVVQTRDATDPLQGCYLLKTVQQSSSTSSVCHCTHYSLTTVCKGPSLQQQYQASWLV